MDLDSFKTAETQLEADKEKLQAFLRRYPARKALWYVNRLIDAATTAMLISFLSKKHGKKYHEIQDYIELLKEWRVTISTAPDNKNSEKIRCKASKEEIRSYFLGLTTKNERNVRTYLIKEAVLEFCANVFDVFTDRPTGKIFELNIGNGQEKRFTYFIYNFYSKKAESIHSDKLLYVKLIVDNFEPFHSKYKAKPSYLKTLTSNFSKRPAKTIPMTL